MHKFLISCGEEHSVLYRLFQQRSVALFNGRFLFLEHFSVVAKSLKSIAREMMKLNSRTKQSWRFVKNYKLKVCPHLGPRNDLIK